MGATGGGAPAVAPALMLMGVASVAAGAGAAVVTGAASAAVGAAVGELKIRGTIPQTASPKERYDLWLLVMGVYEGNTSGHNQARQHKWSKSLVHSIAKGLPADKVEEESFAAQRACYKAVGLKIPNGHFTTQELRGALKAFYLKGGGVERGSQDLASAIAKQKVGVLRAACKGAQGFPSFAANTVKASMAELLTAYLTERPQLLAAVPPTPPASAPPIPPDSDEADHTSSSEDEGGAGEGGSPSCFSLPPASLVFEEGPMDGIWDD